MQFAKKIKKKIRINFQFCIHLTKKNRDGQVYPEKQKNLSQISKKNKMNQEARKIMELLNSLREKIVVFNTKQQTLIDDVALLKTAQEADSKVITALTNEFHSMNDALALTNVFTGKIYKKEITQEEAFAYLKDFPIVIQTILFHTTELKELWYLGFLNLILF